MTQKLIMIMEEKSIPESRSLINVRALYNYLACYFQLIQVYSPLLYKWTKYFNTSDNPLICQKHPSINYRE